jgi:hypothetical protein
MSLHADLSPMKTGFTSFLYRAESLLGQISQAIPMDLNPSLINHQNSIQIQQDFSIASNNQLINNAVFKHSSLSAMKSNEIDLLINGLSDAYDDEVEVDDEAVTRIINLGGEPPSQIQYLSVYASSQRTLKKLSTIRYLNFHINNIVIYSAKYALRKDVTFITVRGPAGVVANPIASERIPLTTGVDITATGKRTGRLTKTMADNFIVGAVTVDKCLSWEISVTDELIQSWRTAGRRECLYIELHSSILPTAKGVKQETHCFGTISIPLIGLVGIEALAAAITSEFEMNTLVYDTVTARMKNLPTGYKSSAKSMSPKIGSITGRVWFQTFDESFVKGNDLAKIKDPVLLVPTDHFENGKPTATTSEIQLSNALQYMPSMSMPVEVKELNIGLEFHTVTLHSHSPLFSVNDLASGTPLKLIIAYKYSQK